MKIEIQYRTPDLDHTTVVVNSKDYVLTTEQYIEIIKPVSRIESSGLDYIINRNKILNEYFINGPKKQFSW